MWTRLVYLLVFYSLVTSLHFPLNLSKLFMQTRTLLSSFPLPSTLVSPKGPRGLWDFMNQNLFCVVFTNKPILSISLLCSMSNAIIVECSNSMSLCDFVLIEL